MANTKITNPELFNLGDSTSATQLPVMTTTQRTAMTGLSDGEMIFNSTTDKVEYWDGTKWYGITYEILYPDSLKMYLDASNTTSYPGTGTTWSDLTNNNNDGTINGATWNPGGYFDFNGSSGYVSIADDNSLDWTTSKSLSIWIRPNLVTGSGGGVISKTASSGAFGWILQQYIGNIRFTFKSTDNSYITTPNMALSINTWTHIAVTYDGSIMKLYKNASSFQPVTSNKTPDTNSSPVTIGRYYSNLSTAYWDGQISKVRMYDKTLSSSEVTALKNEGR